jgi:hypothetical protein
MDWAKEATKDKYLMLLLCGILLWAYIHTHDPVIQTLLVTSVGGFLALVKAGTSSNITQTGSPAIANNDTQQKTEDKNLTKDSK